MKEKMTLAEWLDSKDQLHNFLCEAVWARRAERENHLAFYLLKNNPSMDKIFKRMDSIDVNLISESFGWDISKNGHDFWCKLYLNYEEYLKE